MKERIKELRRTLGLTQSRLGEKIGVKQNTIAQYEMARNVPIDSVISLICREFNVNEQWLRTGEGEMFKEFTRDEEIAKFIGSIQSVEDDTFKKRLIAMLSKLNEAEWLMLEKMALELAQKKD